MSDGGPDVAGGRRRGSDEPGRASPAADAHEDATEDEVADEERQRDDAGRGSDAAHAGWRTQARLFGAVSAFVALIGTVYWFVSYETAGTTFLALTAVLALMTAAYVGWPRTAPAGDGGGVGDHPSDGGGADGGHALEPGHDPHDGVWFPQASIWPLAIGAGMVLVGNGLLIGVWLLLPAAIFLAWAVAGMVRQGRHRI